MTTIRFYRVRGSVSGFTCEGHSGYAEAGEDIVCAAISSSIRMLECTINDVMKAGAKATVDERTTRITLKLPSSPKQEAVDCMTGFWLSMKELQKEYPEHLTVLEV